MISIEKVGELAKSIVLHAEKKGSSQISTGLENAVDEMHFQVRCGGAQTDFKTVGLSQLAKPSLSVCFYSGKLHQVSFTHCMTDADAEELIRELERRLIKMIEDSK